jgi:hypothetical protein
LTKKALSCLKKNKLRKSETYSEIIERITSTSRNPKTAGSIYAGKKTFGKKRISAKANSFSDKNQKPKSRLLQARYLQPASIYDKKFLDEQEWEVNK